MTSIPVFFALSFFIGAIPTAYLVGKYFRGIDIRKEGSGNIGSTNAFRVLGKGFGAFVLIFDFGKGFFPAWVTAHYFSAPLGADKALWIGMAAILGHMFTPFLKFKGGKGVATGAGVLCASYGVLFLVALGVWLGTFFISKIVSLSSLVAVGSLCVAGWLMKLPPINNALFFMIFLLVFWAHRSNIQRLIKGVEKRAI